MRVSYVPYSSPEKKKPLQNPKVPIPRPGGKATEGSSGEELRLPPLSSGEVASVSRTDEDTVVIFIPKQTAVKPELNVCSVKK